MDHVEGPLHILLMKKEGRIWLNINHQFERIYLRICHVEIYLKMIMETNYYSFIIIGLMKFALDPPL